MHGSFVILNSDCAVFQNITCYNLFHNITTARFIISSRILIWNRGDIFAENKHNKRRKVSIYNSKSSKYHHVFLILLLSGDIEINPGPVLNKSLNFGHLNIASIRNKSPSLHNYLIESPFHILALNETWLQQNDTPSFLASLLPPGFSLFSNPRQHGNGGGVAFLFQKFLNFTQLSIPGAPFQSLEVIAGTLDSGNKRICLINIYRPPSSSFPLFISEFQFILETFTSSANELIISGDFNIHVDNLTDNHTVQFNNLLASFDLTQHINVPTHHLGHTLDLLITRSDCKTVSLVSCADSFLSDHLTVSCSVHFPFKPPSIRKRVTFRPWKSLDIQSFKLKILKSSLVTSPPNSPDEYANKFETVLTGILDEILPEKTKLVTDRPPQPWFNTDITDARRSRSQLERAWRHSRLPSDLKRFRKQCRHVRKLVNKAKSEYFSNLIQENLNSPKALWQSLNKLLHREKLNILPQMISPHELANKFLQ